MPTMVLKEEEAVVGTLCTLSTSMPEPGQGLAIPMGIGVLDVTVLLS